MITGIELKNFQSHKLSRLDIHPGINVITGRSDSGKTSIVRAIRWIVFNQPRGKGFISHWAEECAVSLLFQDMYNNPQWVERQVSNSKNQYLWSIDNSLFKAFGTNVPEEIRDLFNLTDINLQLQLDPPFLLAESAGGVARHFNDVANLDVIDTATSNVNRMETTLKRGLSNLEAKKEQLEEKLKVYESLDSLEHDLQDAEALDNKIKAMDVQYGELEKVKNELVKTQEQIAYWKPYADLSKGVEALIKLELDIQSSKEDIDSVRTLILEITNTRQDIEYLQRITALSGEVSKLSGRESAVRELRGAINPLNAVIDDIYYERKHMERLEDLVSLSPEVERLVGISTERDKLEDEVKRLKDDIRTLERAKHETETAERDLQDLEEEFQELMPDDGTCPLCGKKMV